MTTLVTTLALSLLQGLKDYGAREIFGIPGDFVLPFFKVIEESGILPHYTLSHEPGVGFAADAAARTCNQRYLACKWLVHGLPINFGNKPPV